MNRDFRSELAFELLERPFRIGVDRRGWQVRLSARGTCGETLHLPYCHATPRDAAGQFESVLGIGDGEQGSAVPSRQPPLLEQILDRFFEPQETNRVGDRGTVLP